MKECLGCNSSDKDLNFIFETEHWKTFLHPDQAYLGRSIVSLKRHARNLSELSIVEWADYVVLVQHFEKSLKNAFGADPFNWGCLMNNAYRERPYNPHVHWHLRPRYKETVVFGDLIFNDQEFGEHYTRERTLLVPQETQALVIEKIRENLF